MRKILVLMTMAAISLLTACNTEEGKKTTEEITTFVHHDIITVEKVEGTAAVQPDSRIEVRVSIVNIPTAVAPEGTDLVMAGFYLMDSAEAEYNWNNNDTSTDETAGASQDFVQTVKADGSTDPFTFFYDAGNTTTDFKFFVSGTWDAAITDPQQDDGNFKIDFTDFASAGDIVTLTIDAANLGAEEVIAE